MTDHPTISLLPMSPDDALALAKDRVAQLSATIEAEERAFIDRRDLILAYRPRDWVADEYQRAELRLAAADFEARALPLKREREVLIGHLSRVEMFRTPAHSKL